MFIDSGCSREMRIQQCHYFIFLGDREDICIECSNE